jgi:hypothetical protein
MTAGRTNFSRKLRLLMLTSLIIKINASRIQPVRLSFTAGLRKNARHSSRHFEALGFRRRVRTGVATKSADTYGGTHMDDDPAITQRLRLSRRTDTCRAWRQCRGYSYAKSHKVQRKLHDGAETDPCPFPAPDLPKSCVALLQSRDRGSQSYDESRATQKPIHQGRSFLLLPPPHAAKP